MLQVQGLEVRRDSRVVIRDVSFAAARGERVAIMGASGTGKTTVLRAIAGLDRLSAGTIDIGAPHPPSDGRESGHALSPRRVGMVFQFHHLFAHMTALQNVWLAPVHVFRQPRDEAERHARVLLEKLGVAHRGDAMPHELSGGEAQRVAIARALAMNPPVLLLDEPTASLDPARREALASTLRALSDDGTTLLMATHDAEFARGCAQRILVLDGGTVVRHGPPADLLS